MSSARFWPIALAASLFLGSCASDQPSQPELGGPADASVFAKSSGGVVFAEPTSGNCGEPDPANEVVTDAFFYDVDGADVITVIPDPFPDDSLIGYYVEVRRWEDGPIEYFRIVSNEHFDQWNISVFTVDQDIEGSGNWWYYTGSDIFDIVGPVTTGASTEDPTFADDIKKVRGSKLRHVSATVSFANGGQVGQWIGVVPVLGEPEQFFEITANTTRQKNNGSWVNVFVVDGDLQGAGTGSWWTVSGQDQFTIYEPCGLPPGPPATAMPTLMVTEGDPHDQPRP